jgi:putative addiction module killer protein
MFEIRKTETYAQWLDGLHDIRARARIQVRVERLAAGNVGDVKPFKTALRLAHNL